MKGVVFNLFEQFVVDNWGDDVYEAILEETTLVTTEPFVGPGTYPDEDFLALVIKATEKLNVPLPDAVRAFGKFCFPKLADVFPNFVNMHTHPKDFLKTIDSVIHVEVRKLFKDAQTPAFRFEDPSPQKLVLIYESPRKFYEFAEGLLDGVSDYFKTPIQHSRTVSTENGQEFARFELTFGELEPTHS